jgi:hypothetical protein
MRARIVMNVSIFVLERQKFWDIHTRKAQDYLSKAIFFCVLIQCSLT